MTEELTVVGCGPGHPDWVLPAARLAVGRCRVVVGSARLASLFPEFPGRIGSPDGSAAQLDLALELHAAGERVALLVSGDTAVCSLASKAVACLGEKRCRLIPGISSVQLALARVGRTRAVCTATLHAPDRLDWNPAEVRRLGGLAVLLGRPGLHPQLGRIRDELGAGWRTSIARDMALETESVTTWDGGEIDTSGLAIALFLREGEGP
jgi:precorrin-6B methylase 1